MIIAILAAMLLPALNAARNKAICPGTEIWVDSAQLDLFRYNKPESDRGKSGLCSQHLRNAVNSSQQRPRHGDMALRCRL